MGDIAEVREPFIRLSVFVPSEFVGRVMQLVQEKRGTYRSMDYLTPERVDAFVKDTAEWVLERMGGLFPF